MIIKPRFDKNNSRNYYPLLVVVFDLFLSFFAPIRVEAQEIARRLIECFHARKSLVKGERFVRFARKPEYF